MAEEIKLKKTRLNSGLTLLELIIVLVIIAILVLIMLLYFRSQLFKANDAKRKGDLNRISVAVEEYEKDNDCFPKYVNCGTDLSQPVSPYLKSVPCDPITKTSYYYDTDKNSICPRWYRISAKMQDTNNPQAQEYCGPSGQYNYYVASTDAPSCQFVEKAGRWGCKNGVCTPLLWDNSKSKWECGPTYGSSNCGDACGPRSRCDPF